MLTTKILATNELDQVYRMSLNEIIYAESWFPADYGIGLECGQNCIYHYTCISVSFIDRWFDIMDQCRQSTRYTNIISSIKNNGFIYPLAARKEKQHVGLMDGHNRFTAAFDIGMKFIPILIASETTPINELVAVDSNYWNGGIADSLFSRLDKHNIAC